MIKSIAVIGLGLLIGTAWAADQSTVLKDDKDKTSYCIGASLAKNWKRQGLDINFDVLLKGMKDATAGGPMLLTDQQIAGVLEGLGQKIQSKLSEKGKKDSETFLAENKKKEGVQTLPSGLQYKVLLAGTGPTPKATDTVKVHYRGTLVDGTEFDSSYKRGEPITFAVNGVIKGWTEALQLMRVGSKWQLFIPPDLAYGESGGGPIPPNSALIFDVELLGIEKPAAKN